MRDNFTAKKRVSLNYKCFNRLLIYYKNALALKWNLYIYLSVTYILYIYICVGHIIKDCYEKRTEIYFVQVYLF